MELVEAGEADVVVVAYFDRLVRSLTVRAEVVERVEQAGGAILAVDVGKVRADTASRWLSSTMLGLVTEHHRRSTAERNWSSARLCARSRRWTTLKPHGIASRHSERYGTPHATVCTTYSSTPARWPQ